MLRHAPEPTTSTAATSGRPSGLHPTASHTAAMVAPFLRSRGKGRPKVGGFTFGEYGNSHSSTLQVHAEKAGISRMAGVLPVMCGSPSQRASVTLGRWLLIHRTVQTPFWMLARYSLDCGL